MLVSSTTDTKPTTGLGSDSLVSLSRYFPVDTVYFYGYPSGEDSGFLNKVPPDAEELVSARPLVCAGSDIHVVTFANPTQIESIEFIKNSLGAPLLGADQMLILPKEIDMNVVGKVRNDMIKQNLRQMVKPGKLMMAQPFLDHELDGLYQISPTLTNWLNDKQHLGEYIPSDLLAKRYGSFKNGAAFIASAKDFKTPCVVKVSSSSSGDGVFICKDMKNLHEVEDELKYIDGTIIVEQYVDDHINYGVQFGIPYDSSKPIEIIGVNQQLTTPEGEFIGGIIDRDDKLQALEGVKQRLLHEILPAVRNRGWYGIGGLDILVDSDGQCYIIDCNFRMTGMTAYLLLSANDQISNSLVSFVGEFRGTLQEFQEVVDHTVESGHIDHPLRFIAVTYHEGMCRFNAALLYEDRSRVPSMAQKLLEAGVESKALLQLVEHIV